MIRGPEVDPATAVRFLETAFEPDDWLAVFLKRHRTGRVAQRVAPVSTMTTARFQDWLIRENWARSSVYVSVNALRANVATRRRHAVGAIRHVFLDADANLDMVLGAIAARACIPQPSYVLRTSEGRGHVFWRAKGFAAHEVEALEKHLARELHTDPAATARSQLTRLPGYFNHKRAPACRVTVEYGDDECVVYAPDDFPRPEHVHGDRRPSEPRRASCSHVIQRARRYLASVPPAVSGEHGDVHTFRVCCRLVRGFALSDGEALALLAEWNTGCRPPWSERDLIDKTRRARQYGREPIGGLLGDRP